jgi:hypothetical protein
MVVTPAAASGDFRPYAATRVADAFWPKSANLICLGRLSSRAQGALIARRSSTAHTHHKLKPSTLSVRREFNKLASQLTD